jgi:hypothetical protein
MAFGGVGYERGRQLRLPYFLSEDAFASAWTALASYSSAIAFSLMVNLRISRAGSEMVTPYGPVPQFFTLGCFKRFKRVAIHFPLHSEGNKMGNSKLGHCKNQNRPLRVKTGQYQNLRCHFFAFSPSSTSRRMAVALSV